MGSLRVAIYSHDTFGLGHLTRSARIARAVLGGLVDSSVLLLTGSPIAHRFCLPPRVDYLKLPSVVKEGRGDYPARELRISKKRLRRMRQRLIFETLTQFKPHLLMVDNVPLGMKGELLPSIEKLKSHRCKAQIHLNLRDVLDEPEVIRRQWLDTGAYEAIDCYFDAVSIFGCRSVHDAVAHYGLPERKSAFLGYLVPASEELLSPPASSPCNCRRHRVLVTIGGGGDGVEVLRHVGELQRNLGESSPYHFQIVLGPLMRPAVRQTVLTQFEGIRHLTLHDYLDALPLLMADSDLVLSMGGYNTLCEVMSHARRSLVVPRTEPRQEQEIRARAIEACGVIRVLHPRDLTVESLDRNLRRSLAEGPLVQSGRRPPLDAARRLRERLEELLPARRGVGKLRAREGGNGGREAAFGAAGGLRAAVAPSASDDTSGCASINPALGILLACLIWLALGSGGRAEAGWIPGRIEAGVGLGRDGNLLNASDAERRAFEEKSPGAYFVVSDMEDLFVDGRLTAEWELGRPFGIKSSLRGAYERDHFLGNPIKSEQDYALELLTRFAPHARSSLEVSYTPQVYGRHRRDKDARPGDPEFRAEAHRRWDVDLTWQQAVGWQTTAILELGGTWKHYTPAFVERDGRRVHVAVGGERPLTRWLEIGLAGHQWRNWSRNEPDLNNDLSYREWGLEPSLRILGIGGLSRFELSYTSRWRHYTSANPEDWNHFGRDDRYGELEVDARRSLSPSLAAYLGYERTWKDAKLGTDQEIDYDEEGRASDDVITAGLIWRWEYQGGH